MNTGEVAAGVAAGSIALIGFGVDSGIEVVAASALLWRFSRARADASEAEHGRAEQRALYVVSATFFALAAYIALVAIQGLASRDEPENSTVGLILAGRGRVGGGPFVSRHDVRVIAPSHS